MNISKTIRRVALFVMIFAAQSAFAEYKSVYDAMFTHLDSSSSNILYQSMESLDFDLVYSAIKRVGELRFAPAKYRVKEWLGAANPSANYGKPKQLAAMRQVFHISIWTIGRIGNDHDAEVFANYWRDIKDKESRMYIILALGEMSDSKKATSVLNDLTKKVNDERLAYLLLESIEKHHSKSSLYPLMLLGQRPNFSPAFQKRVSQVAGKISRSKQ